MCVCAFCRKYVFIFIIIVANLVETVLVVLVVLGVVIVLVMGETLTASCSDRAFNIRENIVIMTSNLL